VVRKEKNAVGGQRKKKGYQRSAVSKRKNAVGDRQTIKGEKRHGETTGGFYGVAA
jgi:hypothetical protein